MMTWGEHDESLEFTVCSNNKEVVQVLLVLLWLLLLFPRTRRLVIPQRRICRLGGRAVQSGALHGTLAGLLSSIRRCCSFPFATFARPCFADTTVALYMSLFLQLLLLPWRRLLQKAAEHRAGKARILRRTTQKAADFSNLQQERAQAAKSLRAYSLQRE